MILKTNDTETRFRFDAGKVKGFALDEATPEGLYAVGMGINTSDKDVVEHVCRSIGMDMDPALQTTASITVPQQFTQYWDPQAVDTLYTATLMDQIMGETIAGTWADTKYVLRWNEILGQASLYGDLTDEDLVGMSYNYDYRSVVRFQKALLPTALAEAQLAKARIPYRADLQRAIAELFNINQDEIGHFGWAPSIPSTEPTYGFLNEIGLAPYETLPQNAGGTSTQFEDKTWEEIQADFRYLIGILQTQLKGHFNPNTQRFKIVMSNAVAQTLNNTTQFGISIIKWLSDTYKNFDIIYDAKLDGANSGENVIYIFAEDIKGIRTFEQIIQQKMFLVGFEQRTHGKKELYSHATAGVICKRPLAVVRASGI